MLTHPLVTSYDSSNHPVKEVVNLSLHMKNLVSLNFSFKNLVYVTCTYTKCDTHVSLHMKNLVSLNF